MVMVTDLRAKSATALGLASRSFRPGSPLSAVFLGGFFVNNQRGAH